MKIILTSENSVRLVPEPGPMTIEAQSVEQQYSPFHMLGSSLAYCTFSVMHSWATHVKLPDDDLTIDVAWEFAEDPHRVGSLQVTFDWPSLPEKRRNAAKRAAELCTVHATLSHSPRISIGAAGEAAEPAAAPATQQIAMPTATEAPAYRPMSAAREMREEWRPARPAPIERERTLAADAPGLLADGPPRPEAQGDGQEPMARQPRVGDGRYDE